MATIKVKEKAGTKPLPQAQAQLRRPLAVALASLIREWLRAGRLTVADGRVRPVEEWQ